MRRYLRTSQAAALVEMLGESGSTTTFEDAVKRGDFDGVITVKRGTETRWCAESLWMAHLNGNTVGCDDLATIQAFVAEFPLPDDAPGESRVA